MRWRLLGEKALAAIHLEEIAERGRSVGVRSPEALESALVHVRKRAEDAEASVFDVAAAYASAFIGERPFMDGNERLGFLAAYVFLELNGWELLASEVDATEVVLDLAEAKIGEAEFSAWLTSNSHRIAV